MTSKIKIVSFYKKCQSSTLKFRNTLFVSLPARLYQKKTFHLNEKKNCDKKVVEAEKFESEVEKVFLPGD